MTNTPPLHLGLTKEHFEPAAEIPLDALLENPATCSQTIRYVCAVRKALLDCNPAVMTPELTAIEQHINRLYDRLGHERRTAAYQDQRYRPTLRLSAKAS